MLIATLQFSGNYNTEIILFRRTHWDAYVKEEFKLDYVKDEYVGGLAAFMGFHRQWYAVMRTEVYDKYIGKNNVNTASRLHLLQN